MSRFGNRSSAASILQRAQNQLQGKRVAVNSGKKTDEDDIGAYLNTLSLKTAAKKSSDFKENIEISDVSLSSEDVKPKYSASASRFMKKKKVASDTDVIRTNKSVDVSSTNKKPSGASNLHVSKSANFSASSALNKFAAFEKRFDQKSESRSHGFYRKPEKDPSISDDELGKGGSRFLKKKPQHINESKGSWSPEREKAKAFTSTPKDSSKRPPLSKAASFNIGVSDSDEEFMRNLTPVSSPEIPPIRDISDLEPVKQAGKSKSKAGKRSKSRSPSRDKSKSPSRGGRTPSPILKRRTPSPPLMLRKTRKDSVGSESIASVIEEMEVNHEASVYESTVSEETFAGVHVLGIEQLHATTPEPEVRFDPTPRMISPDERSDTDTMEHRRVSKVKPTRQSSKERSIKRQVSVSMPRI
ncbi:serine/arginine-rich splicing factor 4-like [Ptychodera flava]|uniref:serine/arginine-rich splicing factor 4-like n=1 Tax=Ptychodera flava TaxID=63121 RepID=UPI00396A916F